MLEENKSSENFIKDSEQKSLTSYETGISSSSLIVINNKTNKLITALYMVTDIMDKEEPMRSKLRKLGADTLSDIHNFSYRTDLELVEKNINKISQILSFLEIASAVRMISQMNHSILRKEFIDLKDSFIKHNSPVSIEEFLNESSSLNNTPARNAFSIADAGGENKKIQTNSTRIGVQKGSTLMKALKDIKGSKTSKIIKVSNRINPASTIGGFESIKKERREAIIKIIKAKKEATITDIKTSAIGVLVSCGEKTLQRELVSMVFDGVLNKTGEKRWSKYSIK